MICGIDVSSLSLDASIGRGATPQRFANTTEGIALLTDFCHAHQVEMVAMEATGGYERQAFALLSGHGLPVAILNPRAVRQFAQSMGRLEKTDAIDASMIAWFAEVKRSPPSSLSPPAQQQLRALVTRLRQLTDLRTAQTNQQRLVTDPAVQASFTEILALLKRQMSDLAEAIAGLIGEDPLWRELDQAFRSIKADAPSPVDAPVCDLLFIVASVAGRCEPDFIAFRERLANAGKPPKVVRIALAHKLLIRLNAKARETRQRLQSPNFTALSLLIPQPWPGLWERRKTCAIVLRIFHNPLYT